MKNLILVIGRSGSGKDTLVRYATGVLGKSHKIVSVPSYTDRHIRPTETQGVEHTFLTGEEFDDLLKHETIFAYTKIGETGYRYCATVEMLERLDGDTIFYVIDPKGYDYCSVFKDKFNMFVVYVQTDNAIREKRANMRNGDNHTWLQRSKDEDAQFNDFESRKPWDACICNNGDQFASETEFTGLVGRFLDSIAILPTKNYDDVVKREG